MVNMEQLKKELDESEPWEKIMIDKGVFVVRTPTNRTMLCLQPEGFRKPIYISNNEKIHALQRSLSNPRCMELIEAIKDGDI